MDSKVLTEEQIKELVRFIHSRGFREPVVVLEILDHFACKVEELLEAKPDMRFYDAMIAAHLSFGVYGFRAIANAFEVETEKKYKRIFRREFRKVISRPISLLLLPLIAVGYFKFFMWTVANEYNHILDINDAFLVFFLIITALQLAQLFSVKKKYRTHPFMRFSLNSGSLGGVSGGLFFVMVTASNDTPKPEHAWVAGVIFTAYLVYFIPRYFAARQTISKARSDMDTVERIAIDA